MFLPLGISLQPIAKGRERHWDADALWPQPVVQLENPYFFASHQPFSRATAGWKGQGHLDITRGVLSAVHHASLLLYGV